MKKLSLNKYLKLSITLGTVFAFILLMVAGCAEYRETNWNEAIFWDANRTVDGIGVLMAAIGWGFWEFFISAKKQRAMSAYLGMLFTLAGMIMINGYLGIIGGGVALLLQLVVFVITVQQTKLSLSVSFKPLKTKNPAPKKAVKETKKK